jgi:alpha-amylase/alpha-mannosidase (GH57 family)
MKTSAPKGFRAISLLAILAMLLAACDSGSSNTPTAIPAPPTPAGTATAVSNTAPASPTALAMAASPTAAAASATAVNTSTIANPLYVALIWHNHQPFYFKDPTTGVYEKPWVRMHSIKDYLDMVTMLQQYPNAHVTFNMTPSLIQQIDDFTQNNARDKYFVIAQKPAAQLTADDKKFILQRFFDTNDKIINRFPRYVALKQLRGTDLSDAGLATAAAKFQEQDWRDLQTWFNLAWFDPDWQAMAPLNTLISKGQGFTEAEKQTVLDQSIVIMKQVIPAYKAAQDRGQIEIITTPYAHPILPLIYNTDSAKIAFGNSVPLPNPHFSYPQDAAAQVELGKQVYKDHFGKDPLGMWPAEGSVSQDVVKLFANAGINWIASDEQVLASSYSLPNGIERDGTETPKLPQFLYAGYTVSDQPTGTPPVNIIFRDHVISDKIGFDYSGQSGDSASTDLLNRLHNIQKSLQANSLNAGSPYLVTILLDGENAWENYDNDGKAFLDGMYQKLTSDPSIKMVTPSEYFAKFPNGRRINRLFAGSWVDDTFSTWIGEVEENQGWDYLRQTREMLDPYLTGKKPIAADKLEAARLAMFAAEGSDWFWWFGADQDSGDDAAFDDQFRNTLREVYTDVGEPQPAFLDVPIVARLAPAPKQAVSGDISPTIDGQAAPGEWDKAGSYVEQSGGVMANGQQVVSATYYGSDAKNLYLRIDATKPWDNAKYTFGVYLANPNQAAGIGISRNSAQGAKPTTLGFIANYLAEAVIENGKLTANGVYTVTNGAWGTTALGNVSAAAAGSIMEMAIPWSALGDLKTGDALNFIAVISKAGSDIATAPSAGGIGFTVPDRNPIQVVMTIDDPKGDDHGPGTYTYPQDAAFSPGNFDIKQFIVGTDGDNNMVFRFTMNGPVPNPWGSPTGLALQTFDVYIDTDHQAGSGARMLFTGRNAAVPATDAWDVAFRAEGWPDGQGVYTGAAGKDPVKIDGISKIQVDPVKQLVTIRIPRSDFPTTDPATWGYLAVVLSQDGTNSAKWRTRTIGKTAAEWVVGGGTGATNDPGIIDVAYPADFKPTQEDALKSFKPSTATDLTKVPVDDFAQLPMVYKK